MMRVPIVDFDSILAVLWPSSAIFFEHDMTFFSHAPSIQRLPLSF